MDKKHQKADKHDAEERRSDVRDAITSADATGLIASEELITEVETTPVTGGERRAPKPG